MFFWRKLTFQPVERSTQASGPPHLIINKFKKTNFVDLTSPYNLGGPIFNKKDEKLIEFFNKQLINYCKENQVLNLFLRFHPIIKNNDIIDNVNIAETGDYAIVNLGKIDVPIIKNFEYRKKFKWSHPYFRFA